MKKSKFTAGYFAAFSLVEALLGLMKKNGVTRAKLARATGESRSTVTKWFAPGRNLTIFTAASIADALGAELRISVVEKGASTRTDDCVWGSSLAPHAPTLVRVSDGAELRPGGTEEGVSAPVRALRFIENRDARTGAATPLGNELLQ